MTRLSHAPGAPPAPAAELFRITDAEFGLFQALVERESGIQLPEAKRLLLVGRLSRRLRALKLATFHMYYRRVIADEDERVRMIDLISTNETRFFREPRQFEFLSRSLLPSWNAVAGPGPGRVRAWSAACSTGEEAYSIAMTLLSALPAWDVEVFATDISTRVLEQARAALWPIETSREIPEPQLKAFMLRGTGEHRGFMKAGPELRRLVRFERMNLHGGHLEAKEHFDLIFCRNVLIYFDAPGRAAVVNKLLERLSPRGHLFLGHAETLQGITDRLRSVGPNVYSWAAGAHPALCPGPSRNRALVRHPDSRAVGTPRKSLQRQARASGTPLALRAGGGKHK